jgi:hypothetical protein
MALADEEKVAVFAVVTAHVHNPLVGCLQQQLSLKDTDAVVQQMAFCMGRHVGLVGAESRDELSGGAYLVGCSAGALRLESIRRKKNLSVALHSVQAVQQAPAASVPEAEKLVPAMHAVQVPAYRGVVRGFGARGTGAAAVFKVICAARGAVNTRAIRIGGARELDASSGGGGAALCDRRALVTSRTIRASA